MSPTELGVANIFARFLHVADVGAADDLFLLGADSLTTVRIVLELERAFEVSISPEVVLFNRTVGELAAWIVANRQAPSGVVAL